MSGLLTPPGDDPALANAMARLLDDPALRAKLGQGGRRAVIEKFDVERNVQCFANTLWPHWFDHGTVPIRLLPAQQEYLKEFVNVG